MNECTGKMWYVYTIELSQPQSQGNFITHRKMDATGGKAKQASKIKYECVHAHMHTHQTHSWTKCQKA